MEGSKALFCFSEFPQVREGISSKFINNLDKRPRRFAGPDMGTF